AVEEYFRWPVRDIVVVAIGNKQQFRRRADPNTAVTNFQTGNQIQSFGEHFAGLKSPVAVAILQNNDFVESLSGRAPGRVAECLCHPDATALVERKCDRLADDGL